MHIDLTGKSFLVTGAGSGIGAACARLLAESGAFVWVCDIREEPARKVTEEILSTGRPASCLVGDVAEPAEWVRAMQNAPLHGIVHAAGYDEATPLGDTDMRDFERLLKVVVSGPFDLSQHLVPELIAGGGACLLFIASVHALATEPAVSAYAAAKGAQISMVRSIAQDLGSKRIRAVSVSPGYVDTPLLGKWFTAQPDPGETRRHADELHPLGRIGRPEDIAALVTFLLSPQAEFINGVNIVIDGGLTAQLPR